MNKEKETLIANILEKGRDGNAEKESLFMFLFKLQDLLQMDIEEMSNVGIIYARAMNSEKLSDALIGIVQYAINREKCHHGNDY